MNRLLTRASAAFCSLSLLVALVPPVSADVPILEWSEVDTPGVNDLTVVTPSEVTGIAAGRNGVVYAIDGENGHVYRSLDYSVSWEDITKYLFRAGATLPATLIAVAPDNEGIVVVLTDSGTAVYASINGGYDWEDVGLPALAAQVTALAISEVYAGPTCELREIAVGTAVWGDDSSDGEVYVLQGGCSWSFWQSQDLTVDSDAPIHLGADVAALAYSPDFSNDHTLLVVCSTGSEASLNDGSEDRRSKTFLCLGERDVNDGGTDWGVQSPDYPVQIIDAGDALGVSYVRSTLALPSNYSGDGVHSRTLFASIEREPDYDDDVYRVVSDTAERMDVDGGTDINIWSIAYRGNTGGGVLLAGAREQIAVADLRTQVWRTEDPLIESPNLPDWEQSDVPPTGPGHAFLAWAPNVSLAYCGTSSQPGVALDESAFSASTYGDVWRQMALIDTEFTLTELAVAPNGLSLFLTTGNVFGPESVWRSISDPLGYRWQRVLTVDSTTDCVMVRLSADYSNDGTVYVAENGGTLLAVSHTRGDVWEWQRSSPQPFVDLLVVSGDTLVAAIPGGLVMRSTNSGRTWEDPVSSQLAEVNMLSRAADGTLFAGGDDGYVSYSTDGGECFVRIEEPVGTGTVQVRPDVAFADNGRLYAAASDPDEGLWRWKLGVSTTWQQLDDDITALGDGQRIGGLLTGDEGTLYALRTEPASDDTGGMTRWLCPACSPCADFEYNHVIEMLPDGASFEATSAFVNSPPVGTLWGNDEMNDIFAIDGAGQRVFLYRDTLCKRGPYLHSPADGSQLDPNACDCTIDNGVAFDWECLTKVNLYDVGFYLDASVADWLFTLNDDCPGLVVSPTDTDPSLFQGGNVYGWRVRTESPVLSPWSEMWRFYPTLLTASNLQPVSGANNVDVSPVFTWDGPNMAGAYDFALATDPDFNKIVVSFSGDTALHTTAWVCDRQLNYGTNYFWRVRSVNGDATSPWTGAAFVTATASSPRSPATGGGSVVIVPVEQQSPVGDYLIWAMFVLAAVLMVGLILLVLRTSRRY